MAVMMTVDEEVAVMATADEEVAVMTTVDEEVAVMTTADEEMAVMTTSIEIQTQVSRRTTIDRRCRQVSPVLTGKIRIGVGEPGSDG
jgi:hypothetical protein